MVKIGSAYQPQSFERRTLMTYSCLRPATTPDAERLQQALLRKDIVEQTPVWPLRFCLGETV
jgi:hypothetical protein